MKRLLGGLLLTLMILLVSWALFSPNMFRAHDYVHAARIAEMSRILDSGQIPPRWSQNFGFGYGMPLFSFYAPLPYFLGALFTRLNISVTTSIKLLFIISHLVTVIGMYRLGKKWFGLTGGILAASLMVLAPYRAVNIYVRGALSELWGMMTIPWILLSIELIVEQTVSAAKNKALLTFWRADVLMLAGWLSVLLLSHNITAIILLPLLVFWQIIITLKYWLTSADKRKFWKGWWRAIWRLIMAALLGLGLASFYVWPAILEKNLTQVDALILGGYFDYHLHFLYLRQFFQINWGYEGSAWGPDDGLSFFLGYGQILGLALLSIWLFWRLVKWLKTDRGKKIPQVKLILSLCLWLAVGGLILFSTFKSQWLWQALPIMEYIQFPWRFIGVVLPVLALAVASLLQLVPKYLKFVVFTSLLLATGLNYRFFKPSDDRDYTPIFYYTDETRIREEMSGILPDYIPKSLNYEDLDPATNIIWQGLDQFKSFSVLVDKTDAHLFEVEADEPVDLIFSIADYPGFEVEVDGQFQQHQVNQSGLIEIQIPTGQHQVGILWTETKLRLLADSISILSLLLWLGLLPIWKKITQ